jgi:hypothetical protein
VWLAADFRTGRRREIETLLADFARSCSDSADVVEGEVISSSHKIITVLEVISVERASQDSLFEG